MLWVLRMQSDLVDSNISNISSTVDSICMLSSASDEVSASASTCQETITTAFENLNKFSSNVNGTFEQLQVLREPTEA